MGRKAIQDLVQLSDDALFSEMEIGLNLCLINARRIQADAVLLSDNKRERGARILQLAAQEEAAKVLILVDAVRCPPKRPEFPRQLQKFTDHLAKGIYAEYCATKPATFGQAREWVERERKEFYLDGPNDVDWIFYNDILRRREDTIYVDYQELDGGHEWHDPAFGGAARLSAGVFFTSSVLRLTDAMSNTGCLTAAALAEMASMWREVEMQDDFSWVALRDLNVETLNILKAKALLVDRPAEEYSTIGNDWLFPLWSLDLRTDKVKQSELRAIQESWQVDPI